jgi:hypothetical protein
MEEIKAKTLLSSYHPKFDVVWTSLQSEYIQGLQPWLYLL